MGSPYAGDFKGWSNLNIHTNQREKRCAGMLRFALVEVGIISLYTATQPVYDAI